MQSSEGLRILKWAQICQCCRWWFRAVLTPGYQGQMICCVKRGNSMKAVCLLLLIPGVAIASSGHLKCESDGTLIVASSKPMEKLSCNLAVRIIQIKDPLAAVEVLSENPAASMGRYAIASDRIQNQRLRCGANEPAILGIALDNNPMRQMTCGQEVELIRDDGLSSEIKNPGEQQHWYVARDHVDRTDEAGTPSQAQPASAPVAANVPSNTQPPKPQGSAIATAGNNTLHVTWANKSSSEQTMRLPG